MRYNGESIDTIKPTMGFEIKTLNFEGFKVNTWDIGGQKAIRGYWKNYYESTDGIIWVIDVSDEERFNQTKEQLAEVLREERLSGASLLVFANKIDLLSVDAQQRVVSTIDIAIKDLIQTAITPSTFASSKDQTTTQLERHYCVVPCSAVSGEGLAKGITWIVEDIASRIFIRE